jgi:hypothetical protein
MSANTVIALVPSAPPPPSIIAAPYQWLDPSKIPPRPWLYGNQLLRGSVSMIVAAGGAGKTALATGMALSLVTGRDFMGSKIWGGPTKVWLWNLEDSVEELSRGLQAAASYWSISADDLTDNLFLSSALNGDHLKLVSSRSEGPRENVELAKAIVTELKSKAIDVLFIDPFVSSHDANENDNKSMDAVVKLLALIAYEANCSIVLLHHTHKGFGQVNENSARGASSVVNAARSVVTINPLNDGDAKLYDIDEDEMASYIKLHDHKNNRISACRVSSYFKFESVMIKTSDGNEESVGVIVPADLEIHEVQVLTEHQIAHIQFEMGEGFDRHYHTAGKWIGHAVGKAMNLDVKKKNHKIRIKDMIHKLESDGYIQMVICKDNGGKEYQSYVIGTKAKPFASMKDDKHLLN